MAVAIPIMMVVAAAASAAQQSDTQRRQANTAADAAAQGAATSAAQGYAREDVSRRDSAQKLGAMYAAGAQSGVDPNSGSGMHALTTSATNAEYDALSVRYGALAQRDELLTRGSAYRNQARAAQNNMALNTGTAALSAYMGAVRPTTFGSGASPLGAAGDTAWGP